MKGFECLGYGKWILSGEHTVLRGGEALVFPLYDHRMKFQFLPAEKDLDVQFEGERGKELSLVFFGLLEEALKRLGKHRSDLNGKLIIDSSLRLGAGMGASAALCVGVTRLMNSFGWVSDSDLYEFARSLEDLFHGESSGVDIAVSLEGHPLQFKRGGFRKELEINWKPNWYLSYSGQRGSTAECVKKVKTLWEENPGVGEKLDSFMNESSESAKQALTLNEKEGLPLLARSMDLARSAFNQWGLCDGRLGEHMKSLQKDGALAVKPTGSGGGGYVISLWGCEQQRDDLLALN